jgi:hypothetical protein
MMATKKLKQILNSNTQCNATQKRQAYIIKGINQKLVRENAMIVRADKGKTMVIINSDEYSKKVHTFLTENNFHTLQENPTKDHKQLLKTLQQCNLSIDKKQMKYLTQKEPQLPTLKVQIKLYKPSSPIRSIISHTNATYKLAKHLIVILN